MQAKNILKTFVHKCSGRWSCGKDEDYGCKSRDKNETCWHIIYETCYILSLRQSFTTYFEVVFSEKMHDKIKKYFPPHLTTRNCNLRKRINPNSTIWKAKKGKCNVDHRHIKSEIGTAAKKERRSTVRLKPYKRMQIKNNKGICQTFSNYFDRHEWGSSGVSENTRQTVIKTF